MSWILGTYKTLFYINTFFQIWEIVIISSYLQIRKLRLREVK